MSIVSHVLTWVITVPLACIGLSVQAEYLIGQWESGSFSTTNLAVLEGTTNLTLCIYRLEWMTNAAPNDPRSAWLDVQLRYRDDKGGVRVLRQFDGQAILGERSIIFGVDWGSRVEVGYRTNHGVLSLDIPGCPRVELRRTTSDPGKHIR